jgi:ribosomal protein S18 acetylase RimI-like enzyme
MAFRDAGFRIEPLKVADFKSAREIFVECFSATPVADFQAAWRRRNAGYAKSIGIYTKDGDLVGFLLCDLGGYRFENTHIAFLAVHKLFQKYRLGSCLLETLLHQECEARRNVNLTPLYSQHVWTWYHRQGFYVTRYSEALEGGVFTLMNFHHYPTRLHNRHLWFPCLLPVANSSSRYLKISYRR